MITRRGGRGPAARQFNIVCDVCRTPTRLFDPQQAVPGKARLLMRTEGWAYDREQRKDYCPKHAVLASPLAKLDLTPADPRAGSRRVYDFERELDEEEV